MVRLDKRLADTGWWSRKEAKELIRAGRVCVNERICRQAEEKLGTADAVAVDGVPLPPPGPVYLMLHKPAGVVSATRDRQIQTVLSLLPEPYQRRALFPVGRLDRDTEGLLLLTDDGPLAHRLLSPRYHVDKVYHVEVAGKLDGADVTAFSQGVTLADGYTCLPAGLEVLGDGRQAHVTLREGKYHQVRRMLAARGKPVTYLRRISFGPLSLAELPKGEWRLLTPEEQAALCGDEISHHLSEAST